MGDGQSDPPRSSFLAVLPTARHGIAGRYRKGDLPRYTVIMFDQFLARYGGRGFGEIDLGRTRWAEDPTHVSRCSPASSDRRRNPGLSSSTSKLRPKPRRPTWFLPAPPNRPMKLWTNWLSHPPAPHGWIKSKLARFFAGRARQLMGMRESPKFFAVRMMYSVHRELLKTGLEFAKRWKITGGTRPAR